MHGAVPRQQRATSSFDFDLGCLHGACSLSGTSGKAPHRLLPRPRARSTANSQRRRSVPRGLRSTSRCPMGASDLRAFLRFAANLSRRRRCLVRDANPGFGYGISTQSKKNRDERSTCSRPRGRGCGCRARAIHRTAIDSGRSHGIPRRYGGVARRSSGSRKSAHGEEVTSRVPPGPRSSHRGLEANRCRVPDAYGIRACEDDVRARARARGARAPS